MSDTIKSWKAAQPQLERALELSALAQVSLSIHFQEHDYNWTIEIKSAAPSENYFTRDGVLDSRLELVLEHLERIQPLSAKSQADQSRESFENQVCDIYQRAYIHHTLGWDSPEEYKEFWRNHTDLAVQISNAFMQVNFNPQTADLLKLKVQQVGNIVGDFYRREALRVWGLLLRSAVDREPVFAFGSLTPTVSSQDMDPELHKLWSLGMTSESLIEMRKEAPPVIP
jgi:hypothetical protein